MVGGCFGTTEGPHLPAAPSLPITQDGVWLAGAVAAGTAHTGTTHGSSHGAGGGYGELWDECEGAGRVLVLRYRCHVAITEWWRHSRLRG